MSRTHADAQGDGATVGDVARAATARHTAALRRATAMVSADEPDGVHQVRVACRRLRSVLRVFDAEAGDGRRGHGPNPRAVTAELTRLARLAGPARDAEVLHALLTRTATALATEAPHAGPALDGHLLARLDQTRIVATAEVRAAVAGSEVAALLTDLDRLALTGFSRRRARRPATERVPHLVGRPVAAFDRRAQRLVSSATADRMTSSPDAAAWHDARIAAKRARYTADLAVTTCGEPAAALAAALARATDLLGDLHDRDVAIDAVAAAGDFPYVMHALTQQRDALRAAFLDTWPEIGAASLRGWLRP